MKRVQQTILGIGTGDCFNAAVASILELSELPPVDPRLDPAEWRAQWCAWFDGFGVKWECADTSDGSWKSCPAPAAIPWLESAPAGGDDRARGKRLRALVSGWSIAHVAVARGGSHAVVCWNGAAHHDPMPGAPFMAMPILARYATRVVCWSWFRPLAPGERNGFDGAPLSEFETMAAQNEAERAAILARGLRCPTCGAEISSPMEERAGLCWACARLRACAAAEVHWNGRVEA